MQGFMESGELVLTQNLTPHKAYLPTSPGHPPPGTGEIGSFCAATEMSGTGLLGLFPIRAASILTTYSRREGKLKRD